MTGDGAREGHGVTRAANRTSVARPSSQVPALRVEHRPERRGPHARDPRDATEGSLRDRAPLPADPSLCPPLAPTTTARFDAGCLALGLGDLPPGARDAILGHLRLLLAWTAAVNLTAIRDPDAAVTGHLLDSLAAVPLLRAAGVTRFLDLGSGGGYPGLPLALPPAAGPSRRLDRQEGRLQARGGSRPPRRCRRGPRGGAHYGRQRSAGRR
jgi:hypothetical protein